MHAEIDELFLMGAKDCMKPSASQEGQVGKRTKTPVADQDVVLLQFRMQERRFFHVMRSERGRQRFDEKSRAGVKKRQKMGHGKSTADTLATGLPECFLQFFCVGHTKP